MAEECIALCDFVGAEGELSFRKGEILTVLAKGTDSGFWEGISQDTTRRGLFPNCMVTSNLNQTRCAKVFLNKAVTLFDYTARSDKEMNFAKGDLITAVRPSDTAGWWYGVNETQRRAAALAEGKAAPNNAATLAPFYFRMPAESDGGSNCISPSAAAAGAAAAAGGGAATSEEVKQWLKLFPINFITCNIVVAVYPFQGRQKHELTLAVGDAVMVHRRWNDGWWEGSLPVLPGVEPPKASSGDAPVVVGGRRRGIFPSNYTIPNVPTTVPPLFCGKCRSVLSASALTGECKECSRNDEIVRTMMRTLQENDEENNGDKQLDLFQYIDLDPRKGPGSLLSHVDVKDSVVRPRSSTNG